MPASAGFARLLLLTALAAQSQEASSSQKWQVQPFNIAPPFASQPSFLLDLQIPLTRTDPLGNIPGRQGEHTAHLPALHPQSRELSAWGAQTALPFMEGLLLIEHRTQAQFHWTTSSSGMPIVLMDTSATRTVDIRGMHSASQNLVLGWERTRIGYSLPLGSWGGALFELQRHQISLRGSGVLQGQLEGSVLVQEGVDSEERLFSYGENLFSGSWQGYAQGHLWTTRLGARLGPLQWEGTMGGTVVLRGTYGAGQSTPPVLDPLTAQPRPLDADAFTDSFVDSLQEAQVQNLADTSSTPFRVQVPQSHTFFLVPVPWLECSYTWFSHGFALRPPTALNTLDFRRYLAASLRPNHISTLTLRHHYGALTVGGLHLAHGGRLLQESDIDAGWMPLLNGSVQAGSQPGVRLNMEILPWMRMGLGVFYEL